ncbi:MAG: response regulator transcription factor [Chloroflexi bacterium]|nr:response regulator transcription factor [Chloroflexota bacterium]
MNRRIRVLVVDDHEIACQGLRYLLDQEHDIEVVGACSDAEEAFAHVRSLLPDIILMDSQMQAIDGIQATWRLKRNGLSYAGDVIVLAESLEQLTEAMKAGASAYLLKDIERDQLAQAIRQVYQKAHPTPQDGLFGLLEMVILPPASLARSVRFATQVEKAIEATTVQAVGSPEGSCAITMTLAPSPLESIVTRLEGLADVERVEKETSTEDIWSLLRKPWAGARGKSSRARRLLVSLRLT